MNAFDTSPAPKQGNPVLKNGYLVYGDARKDPSGKGFQAWYWINEPTKVAAEWRCVGEPVRFGTELYVTPDLAALNGITYGMAIASQMPAR